MPATLFEYLYRDAGNYKAFGSIVLDGALSDEQLQAIRNKLAGDGFFIAEQLRIPPLYEQLYKWSEGPTEDDHCWHEFAGIKVVRGSDIPSDAHRWGDAEEFLRQLEAVEAWQEKLSPHFRQDPMLRAFGAKARPA